jgi:DNA-binding transcriptional LysR family regulator
MSSDTVGEPGAPMPSPRLPPVGALRCFEAAARFESFTRAAEELHLRFAARPSPNRCVMAAIRRRRRSWPATLCCIPRRGRGLGQLSDVRLTSKREQTFEHFYFSLEAATAGLGVAIGPWALVRQDIAAGILVAPFGFREDSSAYHLLSPNRPETTGGSRRCSNDSVTRAERVEMDPLFAISNTCRKELQLDDRSRVPSSRA